MHITIDNYISTDYVSESAAFNYELNRISASEQLNQVATEAMLIIDHIMDVDFVMEAGAAKTAGKVAVGAAKAPGKIVGGAAKAGTVATGAVAGTTTAAHNGVKAVGNAGKKAVDRTKSFFRKIIDFLKNMFARFKDNMQGIFQNSGKWLLDREAQFDKINYTDLTTDLVPYWDGKESGSISMVTKDLRNSGLGVMGKVKKAMKGNLSNLETFHQAYMKDYILDGDLREGLLNYYRVGDIRGKDRVTLKGDQIKARIKNNLIPYLKSFDQNLATAKREHTYVETTLNRIMNSMNERNIVTESYSDLFQTDFRDTEFALHEDLLGIVMEKDEGVNVKDSSDTNRTKAGVNQQTRDNRTTSEKETADSLNKLDNRLDNSSDNSVRVMYNYASTQQLVMTTFITAMEERFTAYINLLKAIWKAGNTVGGRNPEAKKQKKEEATA